MNERPYGEEVRRACLPELLFVPDVALALGVTRAAARKALRRGDCGAYLRIGRRLAVRRDELMAALARREVRPTPSLRPLRPREGETT